MSDLILIGNDKNNPLFSFTEKEIDHSRKILTTVLSSSMVGDQISVDQFLPGVEDRSTIRVLFAPKGKSGLRTADGKLFAVFPRSDLTTIPYSTTVWYFRDTTLIGKFFVKSIDRVNKTHYDITAVSQIGILDGLRHYGGIYAGQTFDEVLSQIIGGYFPFTLSDSVKSIPVYGWLPVGTRRSNLHQLLFAFGVAIKKDSNGNLFFDYPDTKTVKPLPDNRIFYGGSIDYMTPATGVEVTEHAFLKLPDDENVTLYDNTNGSGVADNTYVEFQGAPCYDLQVSGTLRIIESGVNYAVLSGTGILTGKKYTHTTKIIKEVQILAKFSVF